MKNDVTVIGAGPAGLATAICCASMGLQVQILDCATFPRARVGESVHPGAEALFRRLGIWENVLNARFLRFEGIWVGNQEREQFVPYGGTADEPWKGFQIWRYEFDQILLDRARSAGARIFERCVPADAEITMSGVRVLSNHGTIESRIVVDGTGKSRWLARRWGLKTETCSRPLILRYGYRLGDCPKRRENPRFVARHDGWEWTARVRTDLYQWISLRSDRLGSPFEEPPSELAGLREFGSVCGADVTWRMVTEAASPRHFLVGDAAAVIDPSSSHGTIKALSSGILAASCIVKLLSGRSDAAAKTIEGYCAWQRKWFQTDVRNLKRLQSWSEGVQAYS